MIKSDKLRICIILVSSEPGKDHKVWTMYVRGWVWAEKSTASKAILSTQESSVKSDGDQRTHAHQSNCYSGLSQRALRRVWNRCRQVAIQGHHSQDVDTDSVAAGIESSDYSAHGALKTAGVINYKLVDEERHAVKKEEVCNGQTQDKMFGTFCWECNFHKFHKKKQTRQDDVHVTTQCFAAHGLARRIQTELVWVLVQITTE